MNPAEKGGPPFASRDGAARAVSRGAPVVVAGAGPAGLTAALTLARAGLPVVVAEAASAVGGLARTVERNGYRFDVGGHRFFTRIPEVRALWDEFLGRDMLVRQRSSRIVFHGRAFDYPITAWSALRGLGVVESGRILASYIAARRRPIRREVSIADWFTNQFGLRLFETFFRPYTEKVWGLPCEAIGAQWAAQRIQGLSLGGAISNMLRRGAGGRRTLATEFSYPRLGPGMLWERMAAAIEHLGQRIIFGGRLVSVRHDGTGVREVAIDAPSGLLTLPASHLVSTIPLRDLVASLSPAPRPEVTGAARALRYRDFVQVALILEGPDPVPDTWLYLHDAGIRAGRLQNFRAWSPELIPADDRACVGLEYFCSAGDELWRLPDADLVALATRELASLGLGPVGRVVEGHVVRMRDAYPVYDAGYEERTAILRSSLATIGNLHFAGRNGMHRYNNMDHSMMTGLLAARNVLGERNDVWGVDAQEATA